MYAYAESPFVGMETHESIKEAPDVQLHSIPADGVHMSSPRMLSQPRGVSDAVWEAEREETEAVVERTKMQCDERDWPEEQVATSAQAAASEDKSSQDASVQAAASSGLPGSGEAEVHAAKGESEEEARAQASCNPRHTADRGDGNWEDRRRWPSHQRKPAMASTTQMRKQGPRGDARGRSEGSAQRHPRQDDSGALTGSGHDTTMIQRAVRWLPGSMRHKVEELVADEDFLRWSRFAVGSVLLWSMNNIFLALLNIDMSGTEGAANQNETVAEQPF
eukprot:gnl/TRDRNA2_/TRDRNA2_146573_c3_seq1.p1 gnl/TRDRNA2_/TRDRNA2_146573_c3~~gnl/TRDRNA2_/TRDRNA2_146573_c3_seq1.p1  ORF type:complete len:320 (+),score=54.01 gnl/TRDRNA2_/TRDRNA2_146573_c3_seq1:130-960(+)